MKPTFLIFLLCALPWLSTAQKVTRTVPTVTDLLALPPETLAASAAASLSGTVASDYTATVVTQGYTRAGDGGAGTYFLTNSIAGTNAQGGRLVAFGGARSWELQTDGIINVKQFGAKGDGTSDDTAAVLAAVSWQQSSSTAAEVFFPEGVYLIASSITNATRLRLRGVGGGDTAVAASTILFTGADAPIVSVSGYRNSIRGLRIGYQTIQTETQTASSCVLLNNYSALNDIHDVYPFNGAYGIRTKFGETVWNTTLSKIWVNGFSHSGIRLEAAGTTWTLSDIYIQNLNGRSNVFGTITNVVRTAGTNLTVSCTSLPVNLKQNYFFTISGLAPAAYNGIFVATSISGTDVTCSLVSDPGVDPSDVSGTVSFVPQWSLGPGLYLGFGLVASVTGLDIEQMVTADARMVNNLSANVSIDNLYFESCYSLQPSVYYFDHSQGYDADIGTLSILNCGFSAGQTGAVIRNNGTGTVRVGGITARDIAANGTSWTLGALTGSATNNTELGSFTSLLTVRANASGSPTTYGAVVAPVTRLWDSVVLTGSSGTKKGHDFKQAINQSGTAGYVGYSFDISPIAEGSGTKNHTAFSTGGTNKVTINKTGLTTFLGPDGDLIFIQPNSGQISIYPFDASTSFYEPAGSGRSSVVWGYGDSALNRRSSFIGDYWQVTDNGAVPTNSMARINPGGGDITLGASSSVNYFSGSFVGTETTDRPAPPADRGVYYFRDNGSGKTQFVVRFATGAVQVLATEP